MIEDANRYTFKINDATPETMPFGRLVEYYLQIKRMIGVSDSLHLIEIVESSHSSRFVIDRSYESALQERLIAINQDAAPRHAKRAHDTINRMLTEDETSGSFFGHAGENVIEFRGKGTDHGVLIRIRDAATFTGELYHIAGTDTDAKVRLSTDAFGVVFCTTTKDRAKALRDFLFENVRISGRGLWVRSQEGTWSIDDFVITDFAPVEDENLRNAVTRLRGLGIQWPDDTLGLIAELNESDGAV